MSDDLDFDMEVVGDEELNEMSADGASSSEERSRVKSDGLRNETAGGSDFDTKRGSSDEPNSKALDSGQEDSDQREINPSIKDIDVEGWKAVKAGDLMHITRGASPRPKGDPELFGGAIPWVKISDVDVKSERYATKTSDTVTEKGAKKSKHIAEDTLIVSNSGTCGYPVFLGMDACVHDGWLILKEYEEELNADYLYEYITWKQNYLKSLAPGSTQINLNTSRFGSLDIQVPPLPEQRKIASVLQAVDQAIQKIDEVVETLKNVLSGARKDLFENGIDGGPTKDTPMGRFPERWELKQMGDIGKLLNGNAFPKEYQGSPYGKYPFVKVSDTNNYRKYVRGAKNNISKQELKEIGCRVHPKGTVIMPKRGAAIMTNKRRIIAQPSIIDNNQIGVVGKSVKSSFLYNYLSTVDMGRFVQEGAVKSLTKSLISKIRVPVPEKDEQEKIVNIIDSIEESIKLEEEKKEVYITVKRGLMQDLLTGNVRTVDKAIEVLDEVAVHG